MDWSINMLDKSRHSDVCLWWQTSVSEHATKQIHFPHFQNIELSMHRTYLIPLGHLQLAPNHFCQPFINSDQKTLPHTFKSSTQSTHHSSRYQSPEINLTAAKMHFDTSRSFRFDLVGAVRVCDSPGSRSTMASGDRWWVQINSIDFTLCLRKLFIHFWFFWLLMP